MDITICKPQCIRYIYLLFIKLLRENLFFTAGSAKYRSSHNMIVRCLRVLKRLLNFLCLFWSYYTPSLHTYYVMWPGFDSRTRRHMWTEFVGSLLCCERFFSGYSGFPLSSKTNISKFQFDPGMHGHILNELLRTPRCSVGKQITITITEFCFEILLNSGLDYVRSWVFPR